VVDSPSQGGALSDLPIGVFDSGVGGLTVLEALRRSLPEERFLYLGDTARLPYGAKSPETVRRYALQAAGLLVRRGIKLLVVACNTASAVAVAALRDAFAPLPVVGVIAPGAQAACAATQGGVVLVLGTEGTIAGGAYQRAIGLLQPMLQVEGLACPMFVALAEEGWIAGEVAEAVARRYLERELDTQLRGRVDTIVLGCTHFPVLRLVIQQIAGPSVTLVDSAQASAVVVAQTLASVELQASQGSVGDTRFLATDAPERFARVGAVFLGESIPSTSIELVDL